MTPTHQAAYWKGIARKHEHRYKELGDVPSLLEDAAQWRNHECGESTDRQDLKESDVLELASRLTFKALLSHNGVQGADLDLVMESMNAAAFIDDGQLNVALLATHAARFAPSGEAI